MPKELPEVLNVLLFMPLTDDQIAQIRAVSPGRLNVVSVQQEFIVELEEDWDPAVLQRFALKPTVQTTREERDALLRDAHVALINMPYPKTLLERAPNLLWAHGSFAGVSGLMNTPWWGTSVPVTSARAYTWAHPIAEMVMGATYMLAKHLDYAVEATRRGDMDNHKFPKPKLLSGKTMAIVGLGGIGEIAARLARANGMRVIASRRSATERRLDVDGVDELFPPSELHAMLAEADFIALCVALTDETRNLLDAAAFAAMKPGAVLINVARGEIIDDAALVEALRSGRLDGAYLDVWDNDIADPPPPELLALPNVIMTSHISTISDGNRRLRSIDLFCENLQRLLDGQPLHNLVDWERGY